MKLIVKTKKCGILEFYDIVGKQLGYDTSKVSYSCMKINVAQNIQDKFYEYYREIHKDVADIDTQVAMIICFAGPTVDKSLQDDEVEIFDGFISQQDKEEK